MTSILEGEWEHVETLQEGKTLPPPFPCSWIFKGIQFRSTADRVVYEIVKVDTARTPHLLTTRLLGMWNDGVVQPLQRPGGKKFPSGDMSFLLSGDELRIGYAEESRRQLKQQELYEPVSKKVAIYVLRRVTRGQ